MPLARAAAPDKPKDKPKLEFVRKTIRAVAVITTSIAEKYSPMFLLFVGLSMATFFLELTEERVSLAWYALLAFVGVGAVALDVIATRRDDQR